MTMPVNNSRNAVAPKAQRVCLGLIKDSTVPAGERVKIAGREKAATPKVARRSVGLVPKRNERNLKYGIFSFIFDTITEIRI
jgi:hypothetical protein